MTDGKRKINLGSIDAAFAQGGQEAQTILKAKKAPKPAPTAPPAVQVGRPRTLADDAERIQLRLPKALIRAIKQETLDTGKTESAIVTEWLESKF